ncbi:MAG: hypothetical protein REI12_01825 [Pedobacter sp.]|nr:hypothetical protein [Pedobacter sp.]
MSIKHTLTALALLAGTSAALAGPIYNLDAGYTQFHLEHEISETQLRGGSVYTLTKDNYDSNSALRLGAEAVFQTGDGLDWLAAASATYSGDSERQLDAVNLGNGSPASLRASLDTAWLLNLRTGLRWHQELLPNLHLHADGTLSINQLRTVYEEPGYSDKSSDNFFTWDLALGFNYKFTPALSAVLDAGAQLDNDYRILQYTAGLRYSLR